MKKIYGLITLTFLPFLAYSQGTQVGDSNSPIYHYNGNVGVGINNPSNKLHINSSGWKARFSGPEGYIIIGPANSSWAHIYTDRPKFIFNKDVYAITGGFSSYSSRHLYLKTNGSTRLTISNPSGNVGIGTTSPAQKLHVTHTNRMGIQLGGPSTSSGAIADLYFRPSDGKTVGAAKYWNWSFRTDSWSSAPGDFVLYSHNGSSYTSPIIAQSDGDLLLTTGNGARRNGNVGIGTTSPDYKLDVLGTIRAEEVKVATGWSDFVFEPDFELKSLEQVEIFIEENGHLPDIPSAEEVEENGISLGEMDAKLLQKIEELTLYVIEQNNKQEARDKEIDKLKALVQALMNEK